jgi:hypothetical protein
MSQSTIEQPTFRRIPITGGAYLNVGRLLGEWAAVYYRKRRFEEDGTGLKRFPAKHRRLRRAIELALDKGDANVSADLIIDYIRNAPPMGALLILSGEDEL